MRKNTIWLTMAALFNISAPAGADDYAKFYQAAPPGSVALLPSQIPPEIVASAGDLQADRLRMWEQGYGLIGLSSFNGTVRDPAKALKFARQLKARYVITASGSVEEQSGAIPFTTPTTNQSVTTGNMAAQAGGRQVSGTFNALTTSTGSQTVNIPFSVRRADQIAAYFAPVERKGSGVYGRVLTADERTALGTNKGLKVLAVREGSPAYEADILPGDIVTTIAGQPFSVDAWNAVMKQVAGTNIVIGISRSGVTKNIAVQIPTGWN